MKKTGYHNTNSFFGKTRVVLALLAIMPFLMAVYLFFYEKIDLTDTIILFSALALFSIFAGFYIMRSFADQLVKLAEETGRINTGEIDVLALVHSDNELKDISAHFNTVIKKLKDSNRDLKEQSIQLMAYAKDLSISYQKAKEEEILRNRLSQYLEKSLVEKLINSKDGTLFENERKEVTVLFVDIRAFTVLSESMKPEDVVAMLNQFFEAMVDIIFENNGILDKFVGDQLMAIFGMVPTDNNAACDAVQAALSMQQANCALMAQRAEKIEKTFQIGIGINTGNAIVGNVGTTNRMDYTVIGNCVNVAAFLESIAAGGEIIIGEKTYQNTQDRYEVLKRDEVYIKNKSEPVISYSVCLTPPKQILNVK
jgi:adenylate cyclase